MRYQAALLPDDPPARADWQVRQPLLWQKMGDGGPGRIRTYNLAVMSGRLYR